jgi:hypothetical protein
LYELMKTGYLNTKVYGYLGSVTGSYSAQKVVKDARFQITHLPGGKSVTAGMLLQEDESKPW